MFSSWYLNIRMSAWNSLLSANIDRITISKTFYFDRTCPLTLLLITYHPKISNYQSFSSIPGHIWLSLSSAIISRQSCPWSSQIRDALFQHQQSLCGCAVPDPVLFHFGRKFKCHLISQHYSFWASHLQNYTRFRHIRSNVELSPRSGLNTEVETPKI